jgi:hypothetical protein
VPGTNLSNKRLLPHKKGRYTKIVGHLGFLRFISKTKH